MSIRARVTLFGIGVVALVLFVISVLIFVLLAVGTASDQDRLLESRATAAVESIRTAAVLDARSPLTPVDAEDSGEIIVVVLDAGGQVLSSTGQVAGSAPVVPAAFLSAAAQRPGGAVETVTVAGVPLRVWALSWTRADLDRSGHVVAAQSIKRLQADRVGILVILALSDFIGLGAASVAIWFAVGRALRPLRELTVTADEIGRSADLTRRLPAVTRRDDVGRLTASFNAMMARLDDAYRRLALAFAAQQRFTADASHELRTPLTTIRSNVGFLRAHPSAEAADRTAALDDLESDSARMTRLVEDLLTLARADSGQRPAFAAVDLGSLAHEVCRQASGLHPDRTVHCAGAPAVVPGDVDALRRVLWILLDNAVAHTSDGGNVWVAVTASAGSVTLQVSDDGGGIPPGLEERVFDRFFRAPGAERRGSGLGLSIARSLVAAHGGRITAGRNPRGGAALVAEFPVSSTS